MPLPLLADTLRHAHHNGRGVSAAYRVDVTDHNYNWSSPLEVAALEVEFQNSRHIGASNAVMAVEDR